MYDLLILKSTPPPHGILFLLMIHWILDQLLTVKQCEYMNEQALICY